MNDPLTIEDVVAKGRPHYHRGESLERWKTIMLNKYGPAVIPRLREAWDAIEGRTTLPRQDPQSSGFPVSEANKPITPDTTILYQEVAPSKFAPVSKMTDRRRRLLVWQLVLRALPNAIVVPAAIAFVQVSACKCHASVSPRFLHFCVESED